jgi:hypothetical protein
MRLVSFLILALVLWANKFLFEPYFLSTGYVTERQLNIGGVVGGSLLLWWILKHSGWYRWTK